MAAVACGHRDLISDSGYYQTPTSVYYAVKQGKHVRRAIFPCWNDALQEIEGFEAAQYDSFHDLPSAVSYLLGGLREHAASDRQLETRMTLASEHFTPALSAVITNGNNGPQNPPSATIPVAAMDDEKRRAVCSTKMSRKRSRQSEEDGWTNMLEEFIQSRNTDRKKSRDLYQWINTQRTKYKNSELSKDRTKRLEEAGFEFTPKIHTFEERVEQLKTFKETHGHFKIPGSKTNGLSGFVTKLRTAHKKYAAGEKSSMTPEREQQLREIGFEFEVGKRYEQIPWEQRFQQLLEFKQKYGHTNVPLIYADNRSLGYFVKRLRSDYKNLVKGKSSSITLDRVVQLTNIGFEFDGNPRKGHGIDPIDFTKKKDKATAQSKGTGRKEVRSGVSAVL